VDSGGDYSSVGRPEGGSRASRCANTRHAAARAGDPNARLLVLSPAGHFPFLEQADLFFPAVRHFLDGEFPGGIRYRAGRDRAVILTLRARAKITSRFRIPSSGHLAAASRSQILNVALATPPVLLPQDRWRAPLLAEGQGSGRTAAYCGTTRSRSSMVCPSHQPHAPSSI
jgi:hypothetical protein